ncbi:hypothetical protein Y032_0257g385 [Ancylostoma ceylanicum]|uniref:Uncharacterized protein n=1 Tax=Ancylostoma ceylanicum TaxID=53326 RepID=A0A016SAV4_9BILA|nr:hypothetical protein Y032_0257g385 [Ancylostoma ceylanicum]
MVYKLLHGTLPVELHHTSCNAVRKSPFRLSVTYAQKTTPQKYLKLGQGLTLQYVVCTRGPTFSWRRNTSKRLREPEFGWVDILTLSEPNSLTRALISCTEEGEESLIMKRGVSWIALLNLCLNEVF